MILNPEIFNNLIVIAFKSSVVEFGPVLEIDFFKFHPGQNNTGKAAFGTPYFMGSINIMRMNQKTRYNGEWIELQPLVQKVKVYHP